VEGTGVTSVAAPTAIIQARMGSTRLPGKVLLDLVGKPMLWHVVQRARAAAGLTRVVVATTVHSEDDAIRQFCATYGIPVYSGSSEDVLDRYYQAAIAFCADPVVRITSDCPMVDPTIVDQLLEYFAEGAFDSVGIAIGGGARAAGLRGYPDGLDAECVRFSALETAWRQATSDPEREHVTPYIWNHDDLFKTGALEAPHDYSELRLTVDEPEDLELVRRVYEALYRPEGPLFEFGDVIRALAEHPEWVDLNREHVGREKYRDLWRTSVQTSAVAKETS
jgi:spore coat polysaccharide biosynthesis protein SpsF